MKTFENKEGTPGPCIHCGEGIAMHAQSQMKPLDFICTKPMERRAGNSRLTIADMPQVDEANVF